MRHREVECEDEADDPGNVSQTVVARENAGDHFAGLANRKLAEDDRRGEDREEKHPAEPAYDAEQIDEEGYHHVGSGTGLVIRALSCGRSVAGVQLRYCLRAPGSGLRSAKPPSTGCHASTLGSPNCQQRKTTSPSSTSAGKSTSPWSMSLRKHPNDSTCCASSPIRAAAGLSSG